MKKAITFKNDPNDPLHLLCIRLLNQRRKNRSLLPSALHKTESNTFRPKTRVRDKTKTPVLTRSQTIKQIIQLLNTQPTRRHPLPTLQYLFKDSTFKNPKTPKPL